jgi:hypothetical protein
MATAIPLVLQPEPRPNGLVSVLRPLPDGWERGVDVMIRSVPDPIRIGPCETGEEDPEFTGTPAVFQPVVIRQGVICSLLGRPDTEAVSRNAAEVAAGYALSLELYDGAGTSNPSLVGDAVEVASPSVDTVVEAIAALENAMEQGLHGAQGVIHVPLGLSAYLGDMIYRDGNRWRTAAGNLVAIHGLGSTIYGTGEVWGAIGSPDSRRYNDVRTNTSEGWSDIAAIAIFDPSTVWSVDVDLEA